MKALGVRVERYLTLLSRWLKVALTAMLLGLGGLIALVHSAVMEVDRMSQIITFDTAPGIVALQGMTVNVSHIRNLLRESLSRPDELAALKTQVEQERVALEGNEQWWRSLPLEVGEEDLMDETARGIARLDEVARLIMEAAPTTTPLQRDRLRAELDATTNDLDGVLLRASKLNADAAASATETARRVERRLLPAAIAIEGASIIFATLALVAIYRLSRTETMLAERRLLQVKNAELEAFGARVAHDVLSPLMTVGLALGMAEQRLSTPDDARVHGMLLRATSALQRVRQVVTDLLSFARAAAAPEAGAETEVAPLLKSLMRDLEPVAAQAGVDLHLDAAAVRVQCASGILTSIVTNLVQNAIRHTDSDEHRVDVRAVDAGKEVRLEVEDTGPGIAPDERERIFEPYVRAPEGGGVLGLGLATVKRLAESHGGHVGVSSPRASGHGALFWVTLPAPQRAGASP
jgi:signal transduction histidine kinase